MGTDVLNVITIGFDKGGKILMAEFAKRGQKMTAVERSDKMYGGTCINIGCISTKTLIHQVEIASGMKGLTFLEKKEFYQDTVSVKNSVTGALRNKNYHDLADNPRVTVYAGFGPSVPSDAVSVRTTAEELLSTAKQITINTGVEATTLSIDDIAGSPSIYANTSIMEPTDPPCHFVIVNGGYIRLEFASMYTSFSSQAAVFESHPELTAREDRDIAASVKEALGKEGIISRMNTKAQSVDHTSEKAIVAFTNLQTNEAFELEADAVPLATGRRPNTQGLYLETAGVEADAHGAIIVDEYLKTMNLAIRAVSDAKGGLQFTYVSLDDYQVIGDDLFGNAEWKTSDRNPVSHSVFIDPLLVRVGPSEEKTRKQNLNITVKKLPVMAISKTKTLREMDGSLKAIIDEKTGLILGCVLFAPDLSEVINTVTLAMKTEQDYTFPRDFIFTYPSMSEALSDLFVQQHPSIYS